MKTHAETIAALGGIRAVARMLEHSNHTTVQGWVERNSIPMDRWADLIQRAGAENKVVGGRALTIQDLMPQDLRDAERAQPLEDAA